MSYGFETMNSLNSFNEIPKLYQNRAFWKFAAFIGCKSDLAANVLDDETITYDTNATACHMLRHYLLARVLSMLVLQSGSASATEGEEVDGLQSIGSCKRNVGAEEQLFAERRPWTCCERISSLRPTSSRAKRPPTARIFAARKYDPIYPRLSFGSDD
jgi:hypothetical protein